jgi:hypothetical protein
MYCGASEIPIDQVMEMIDENRFEAPDISRLPLVVALHDELSAQISRGVQGTTVKTRIYCLRTFFSWCDENHQMLTIAEVANAFRLWVEFLLHRVRIKKDLKNMSAYRPAKVIDNLLKPVLDLRVGLLSTTRLTANAKKHKALGSDADKQNLDATFQFGHFLMDVTSYLTESVMTGPLPVIIPLRGGHTLTEHCGLQNISIENCSQDTTEKNRFIQRRSPITADLVFEKRHSLVNLRIECEILIFISQTSMNLSQAANLKQGRFRYQTHGDDILVYRVYKGRRGGEAEFTIFKEYAPLFKSYLEWLATFCDPSDDRLFPFVYPHKIPTEGARPRFQSVIARCEKIGIRHFRPLALRKTRINWLLRKSRSPDLVAEMAQHTKQTLMQVYEEPHHQVAAVEISRFYRRADPSVSSTGPGLCVATVHPRPSQGVLDGQVPPDCITPAGCLFCEFQRDIDSEDYIWSLATFKYLKMLELDRFVPPQGQDIQHPVQLVIDRTQQKLSHMAESSDARALWVEEAGNRIREGRFHQNYEGLIQLMESAL